MDHFPTHQPSEKLLLQYVRSNTDNHSRTNEQNVRFRTICLKWDVLIKTSPTKDSGSYVEEEVENYDITVM